MFPLLTGTSVYANVWGPLHDPEVYPKPEEFRADRFLDEEGNFCSPDPKYFPVFSAGMLMGMRGFCRKTK